MSKFVHQLTRLMTKREKAYFKRFSQMHGENKEKNYLRLFDFLQKEETFDEAKLRDAFDKDNIGKNLTSEISYLQNSLLKCLTNYHLDSSIEFKLQKFILYIELLIVRGFPKQALKILNKAKKLANENEDFSSTLKLIQLEEEILFREGAIGFVNDLEKLQEERENISDKIRNLNRLRLLREQVREFILKQSYIHNPKKYPFFFKNKTLESPQMVLSTRAMEHWLYTKGLQGLLVRDFEMAKKWNYKMVLLIEENDSVFKKSKIYTAISNYLYCCALLGDIESFDKMLIKLKNIENDPKLNLKHITYIRFARQLELYFVTGMKEEMKKTMNQTIPFYNDHKNQLEIAVYSNLNILMVRGCIIFNELELALDLLNDGFKRGYIDIFILRSRLYLLIVYFELNWGEIIVNEVETSAKFLKRHNMNNQLTKVLLKFFKNSVRTSHRIELHYIKLIDSLKEIRDVPQFIYEFESFDYLKWAEEKVKKTLS